MRRAVLLVALIVLSGCQGLSFLSDDGSVGTPTPTEAAGEPVDMGTAPPDPDEDRLGWENGYWHNESISIDRSDGLNDSELEAVVSRSMARVEYVRELEFERTVEVDVINRSTYREERDSDHSEALERFDNAKFEALFLIGETDDSIDVQDETRGTTVLGYYSTDRESIVLVDEGSTATLSGEEVLAHELVHALQDQHFELGNLTAETRDAYQGRNGIVEGDAVYVQHRYMDRCGESWDCLGPPPNEGEDDAGDGDGSGDVHAGVQVLDYFPYSDGPGLVGSLHDDGGWEAVNDAYGDVPDGAPEVTYPDRYPDWEPAEVSLEDRAGADWERIRPPDRPDHGVMGQSAIVASQAYTLADEYNDSAVVTPRDVLNVRPDGAVNQDDPYDYDTATANGWEGGRFHAYERDDGELAYVWRTRWSDTAEAQEFADGWDDVIQHWGGERVGGDTWVIDQGPYADAFEIRVDGDTVTIVNAPSEEAISTVHAG